jgi:hypothetical protein
MSTNGTPVNFRIFDPGEKKFSYGGRIFKMDRFFKPPRSGVYRIVVFSITDPSAEFKMYSSLNETYGNSCTIVNISVEAAGDLPEEHTPVNEYMNLWKEAHENWCDNYSCRS